MILKFFNSIFSKLNKISILSKKVIQFPSYLICPVEDTVVAVELSQFLNPAEYILAVETSQILDCKIVSRSKSGFVLERKAGAVCFVDVYIRNKNIEYLRSIKIFSSKTDPELMVYGFP